MIVAAGHSCLLTKLCKVKVSHDYGALSLNLVYQFSKQLKELLLTCGVWCSLKQFAFSNPMHAVASYDQWSKVERKTNKYYKASLCQKTDQYFSPPLLLHNGGWFVKDSSIVVKEGLHRSSYDFREHENGFFTWTMVDDCCSERAISIPHLSVI